MLAIHQASSAIAARSARSNDEYMWFGAKSMFDNAGFKEVARRKPQRPVVRINLPESPMCRRLS
jgi:hypothetical protein